MKTGVELIANERQEQLKKHGWSLEHDLSVNKAFQLSEVASILANQTIPSPLKRLSLMPSNWDDEILLKMCKKPYKDRLIIAGALIAAELDRLQRLEATHE